MKNKYLRYIFGFVLLAIILISLNNNLMLFIMSVFFIVISMMEYRHMFVAKNIYPHKYLPEIMGAFLAYGIITERYNIMPILTIGFMLCFIITIIRNKKPYMLTSFSTLGGIFFIFLGLYIIKIYQAFGINVVLVYFAAILAADFAASVTGKLFKPVHIFPEISPNKTLIGTISHLIVVCLLFLILHQVIGISIGKCILIGIITSLFSQFGDLSVSLLKRDLGIKHSSSLFMDYGGIFDRIDAFLFSAPIFFYCILHIV